jgi:hypothetical protein
MAKMASMPAMAAANVSGFVLQITKVISLNM